MELAEVGEGIVNLVCLAGLIVYIITALCLLASVLASIFCGSYDHQVSWSFIPKTIFNFRSKKHKVN